MSLIGLLLLGLGVGVLIGLMGVGGGVLLVPALAYLVGMNQHLAQGTSLLIQLPPVGIGALYFYWKRGQVDGPAGVICAAGFLLGGYGGSLVAVGLPSATLRGLFGLFLMFAAVMLARQTLDRQQGDGTGPRPQPSRLGLFLVAFGVGVLGGLFGVGGGIVLVPVLVLLFHFDQHRAQGTSLAALVPPTGLLAFLGYYRAGHVDWRVGLLLIPGVFLGGIVGSKVAQKISPVWMRRIFAAFLFVLGAWQALSLWLSSPR